MTPLQLVSRPLLGAFFVNAGWGTLSKPEPPAEMAAPFLDKLRERVPLSGDDVTLVRVNAAVQVVAGALLTAGRLPRTSALALAASLLPTTLAGHPFWEEDDPGQRASQRIHFGKNVAIMGGLLSVVSDANHQAMAHVLRARAKARKRLKGSKAPLPR
ncbi:DoxX family protein [Streptomyces sp. 891-h]|uniref:DoxX family protein n=1 Tax=unclassified Streptomyces TaxID=2593676 RepID=UPI001FA9B766|nr:DoxX family protein [Streptomyces sp. 891-h]UNZ16436.1 DoxX family protein [Streptomyces sp. 891-h]